MPTLAHGGVGKFDDSLPGVDGVELISVGIGETQLRRGLGVFEPDKQFLPGSMG